MTISFHKADIIVDSTKVCSFTEFHGSFGFWQGQRCQFLVNRSVHACRISWSFLFPVVLMPCQLKCACLQNLVELLVTHKADINAKTNAQNTPLHLAAIFGHAGAGQCKSQVIFFAENSLLFTCLCTFEADQNTPYHMAAIFGDAQELEIACCKCSHKRTHSRERAELTHLSRR